MKLGINDARITAIANAIRDKKETQDAYTLAEMPDAIESIEPEAVIESKNINANGTYTAPTGVDGYSPVVVNVPNSYSASDEGKVVDNGALVAQTSRTIDENGTYDTTLNNEVVVDVQGGSATLISKTITQNGTYNAEDDDADGYSEVTVDVSGGGGDAILKTVKIWTHSTGGQDASLYAQEFTWDGESLTAVGSPTDISFWPFYNHEYEYLDLFDAVRLSYSSPNWVIRAITDVVYNGNVISAGNQITYWHYATSSTCFVICDVEGGGGAEPIDLSYLPNSDSSKVFVSQDSSIADVEHGVWGRLGLRTTGTQTESGLFFDENDDGSIQFIKGVAVYDIGGANKDVTMYAVMKKPSTVSGDIGVMGIAYGNSSGNAPNFYNRSSYVIRTSVYGGADADTSYSLDAYRVLAISLNNSTKTVSFYIDGEKVKSQAYSNSGRFVVFNSSGVGNAINNCMIQYAGIVDECESDATIIANMQTIATKLGLTI